MLAERIVLQHVAAVSWQYLVPVTMLAGVCVRRERWETSVTTVHLDSQVSGIKYVAHSIFFSVIIPFGGCGTISNLSTLATCQSVQIRGVASIQG